MPYIGLARSEGTKMWAGRRRLEESDRQMQASKDLWDAKNDMATAMAKAANAEAQQAVGMQMALVDHAGGVLAGDAETYARVANMRFRPTDRYTYKGLGNTLQLVDKKTGKVINSSVVPSGEEGLLTLRSMGNTTTERLKSAQETAKAAREMQHDLNKISLENKGKTDVADINRSSALGSAGIAANASMYGANKRLEGDMYKANLDFQGGIERNASNERVEDRKGQVSLTTAQMQQSGALNGQLIAAAISDTIGSPVAFDEKTSTFFDTTTGSPVSITAPKLRAQIQDTYTKLLSSTANNAFATPSQQIGFGLSNAQQGRVPDYYGLQTLGADIPSLGITSLTAPAAAYTTPGLSASDFTLSGILGTKLMGQATQQDVERAFRAEQAEAINRQARNTRSVEDAIFAAPLGQ